MVLGSKVIFHPLGPEPESSTSSAGAVPVLVTTTGIEVSLPAVASALIRPSRPESESRGWPVMSSSTWVCAVASSAETRIVTG